MEIVVLSATAVALFGAALGVPIVWGLVGVSAASLVDCFVRLVALVALIASVAAAIPAATFSVAPPSQNVTSSS